MNAEAVIEMIKKPESAEIERLFLPINDDEAEVRCYQAPVRYGGGDERFKEIVDGVSTESKALLRKLAALEAKERETSVK